MPKKENNLIKLQGKIFITDKVKNKTDFNLSWSSKKGTETDFKIENVIPNKEYTISPVPYDKNSFLEIKLIASGFKSSIDEKKKYSQEEINLYDIDYFFDRLNKRDNEYQYYAAMWALSEKCESDPKIREEILKQARNLFNTSKVENVRIQCMGIVSGAKAKDYMDFIVGALHNDRNEQVRSFAAYSLPFFKDKKLISELEESLKKEKSERVIRGIETAIERIRKQSGENASKCKVKTYRVIKGDSLFSIANKIYGNKEKWQLIYSENRDFLKKPGSLKAGQILIIPIEEKNKQVIHSIETNNNRLQRYPKQNAPASRRKVDNIDLPFVDDPEIIGKWKSIKLEGTERKKLLAGIVKTLELQEKNGALSDSKQLFDARIKLLRAELELCKTRRERISLLDQIVRLHKDREDMLTRMYACGKVTQTALDNAKVGRLEAQEELANARLTGTTKEPQQAPDPGLVLSGTVTDAKTGKPIAGAKVSDDSYSTNGAMTDASGKYQYATWAEEHNVIAIARGYRLQLKVLTTTFFQREKAKTMDFELNAE